MVLPVLPTTVTLDDVLVDFMRCVESQLRTYFVHHFEDGENLWRVLSPEMDVVLTTPNGWELPQQQRMRMAAQKSGLVFGSQSAERVRFVSEAEVCIFSLPRYHVTKHAPKAAIMYSIETGCINEWIKVRMHLPVVLSLHSHTLRPSQSGAELILCDCGGKAIFHSESIRRSSSTGETIDIAYAAQSPMTMRCLTQRRQKLQSRGRQSSPLRRNVDSPM
jgi:hypothetical protein